MDLLSKAIELQNEINPQVQAVYIAGSIRRGILNNGDIDFVIIPKYQPEQFKQIELKDSVSKNWEGNIKIQHVLNDGTKVDFVITNEESFGACLLYFTGPKWFNIRMRTKAKFLGGKLNEYGLYDAKGIKIAGDTEEGIFEKLLLEYIPPEKRK